ncbi:MAG: prephenate dehydratase [Selenomonadaceae bacterium]|uniref:prephenate dehydratase n=1 Tax=Selenomonas bovis TaxID=416586 RepID=UPI002A946C4A|nr:prephenate dehydratase [Selenomonadaceae bacterium]
MEASVMGYLGPMGTHSEAAARWLSAQLARTGGGERELRPFADIDAVLHAVEAGEVASGFVPVENSLEGAIHVTLDTLARSEALVVAREVIWPVHNELMARCEAGAVRRIYSHAQPISQCRAYLSAHFPQAELVEVASTARAAKLVAAAPPEEGLAAICTARAGELYGLSPLAHEIQDSMANCTRFFEVVRRGMPLALPQEKLLIICQLDGSRAGSLVNVLQEFAVRGINMTRIESRPARTRLGDYIFFFDLETAVGEACIEAALAAVRAKCSWLKNLGAFPVLQA